MREESAVVHAADTVAMCHFTAAQEGRNHHCMRGALPMPCKRDAATAVQDKHGVHGTLPLVGICHAQLAFMTAFFSCMAVAVLLLYCGSCAPLALWWTHSSRSPHVAIAALLFVGG